VGFDDWVITAEQQRANKREQSEFHAVKQVCEQSIMTMTRVPFSAPALAESDLM
jgi:hypothetical protein